MTYISAGIVDWRRGSIAIAEELPQEPLSSSTTSALVLFLQSSAVLKRSVHYSAPLWMYAMYDSSCTGALVLFYYCGSVKVLISDSKQPVHQCVLLFQYMPSMTAPLQKGLLGHGFWLQDGMGRVLETRTNWTKKVRELILDSDSRSQGLNG